MKYASGVLAPLGALAHVTLRLWRLDGEKWRLVAGPRADAPAVPRGQPGTASWLALPAAPGLFLEIVSAGGAPSSDMAQHLMPVVEALIEAEAASDALGVELAARYQEIDLLYSIGELLGRSRLGEDVADTILREVAAVVGARRAALRLWDESRAVLRVVASLGSGAAGTPGEVAVDDPHAVVARAFRGGRVETGANPEWAAGEIVAVPISHARAGGDARVVGTLALADRAGGGAFTQEEIKLIAAVAMQIGTALENARLAARERDNLRIEQELRVAHELQIRLMPTPAALRGEAEVAARSEAAASVGGDFYTFGRLGRGRIGILLGDVASHGLPAALIAAQVLAAAGIHANSTTPPDEMLGLLRSSLADELAKTEMYLTVFYAIMDPTAGRLVYASAGHPYAFRVPRAGVAERLEPTAPPLGLEDTPHFGRRMVKWEFGHDLLVLYTDGLVERPGERGPQSSERRIIERIEAARAETPERIAALVWEEVAAHGGPPRDDRTLLILRM